MKNFIILCFLILVISFSFKSLGAVANHPSLQDRPYVVMLSMDGFRYDFAEKYAAKNILEFKKAGSYAQGLKPVWPSKTFPNHYSLATGLYAENHGIVSNSFYDPNRDQLYKLGDAATVLDGSWYGGEPLWIATQKAGLLSASYFWVGSDANIQGLYPSYYFTYDGTVPNIDRVDQVIKWLKLPKETRPHLITLYFSDVDSAGHKFGTTSKELKEAIGHVDSMIGRLMLGLKALKLPINVILVSDHGLQDVSPKKVIYLQDYIDIENPKIKMVGKGTLSLMYIRDQVLRWKIYKKLKKVNKIKVYRREKMPRRFHFKNNERIGDLMIQTKSPYYLLFKRDPNRPALKGATHGYKSSDKNMMGIFYAQGPHIKKGKRLRPFTNIHVYPLVMRILGLPIKTKIDGRAKVTDKIFQSEERGQRQSNR